MNISNIIAGVCSLLFFMIGADKFLAFLEPPCSLEPSISPIVWKALGALQLAAGVLILFPKYRKAVAGFFTILMAVFIGIHLSHDTQDIKGAASMAIMLGLLYWNPSFMRGKSKA